MNAAASDPQTANQSGFQTYKRLLGYVWPYRGVFTIAVIGLLVVAASEFSFAALLKPIMDEGFVERDEIFIQKIPLYLTLVFVARALGQFVESYSMAWLGRKVIFDLRGQMFARLMLAPTAYYDANTSASLISKLIYDVEQVAQASTAALRIMLQDSIHAIVLLSYLFYLNARLAFVLVLIAPVIAVLLHLASQRFRVTSRNIQITMGGIADVAKEAFQGHHVVKIFAGQKHEQIVFGKANADNRRQFLKKAAVAAASVPLVVLTIGAAVVTIIYIAVSNAQTDNISAGTFVSFLGALLMLLSPLKRLMHVNEIIQTGIAAAQSVFFAIDGPIEQDHGTAKLGKAAGRIEFDKVSFQYTQNKGDVLRNISFNVEPGQMVALVGSSGSGKTTTASLLFRFYPLSQGEIRLDGKNINELPLNGLRENLSMVTQNIVLFNDTIKSNIAYGDLENLDEVKLMQAAKAAHVDEFAKDLPNGYETQIGEQGMQLSGGQRQRLAIARAIYKNAPILVMDEATSSLDAESEFKVQQAITALLKKRTTLVIAHRLSTIQQADLILVFSKGQIVERGTHDELIERQGFYTRLYETRIQSDIL